MVRESLAGKAPLPGDALTPPSTDLEYEFTDLATLRVPATGESSHLDGTIRKPVDRVSAAAWVGAASLERDPCGQRGGVTVLIDREATPAYQPNGMAITPFDRLARRVSGHERLPPSDLPFVAREGWMHWQQQEQNRDGPKNTHSVSAPSASLTTSLSCEKSRLYMWTQNSIGETTDST